MKRKLIGVGLILANIAFSLGFPDRFRYIITDVVTGGPSLYAFLGTASLTVGIWLLGGNVIIPSENEIFTEEQNDEEQTPRSVRKTLLSRVMYGSAEFDDDSQ